MASHGRETQNSLALLRSDKLQGISLNRSISLKVAKAWKLFETSVTILNKKKNKAQDASKITTQVVTLNLPEENIGELLQGAAMGNGFLSGIPKAQETKAKQTNGTGPN